MERTSINYGICTASDFLAEAGFSQDALKFTLFFGLVVSHAAAEGGSYIFLIALHFVRPVIFIVHKSLTIYTLQKESNLI